MATIEFPDGTQTYLEPSSSDRQREESHAANAKVHAKSAAATTELLAARKAAAAALPSEDARFQTILLGTTRLAARFKRTGDSVKSVKLATLAEKIASELEAYRTMTAKLAAPRATPLADAVARAGKELSKRLPESFPTIADAESFAGRELPLTDARAAQVRSDDAFGKLSKSRALGKGRLWDAIQQAARLATGINDDGAIRTLETAGEI